jgi:tryptophanyl-tRNA synthetase
MRIFSGIQPTGSKHFGNYSGGFRQYVATSEEGEGFFCVVDLHSISVPYDPEAFRTRCLDLTAMLFATGLDPARSTIFVQSHVPAHAEANWLLGSIATFGELRRMTQFKEKSVGQSSVSAALFTYPVLMAGDILLYQADTVPVGDDQRQHIELARKVAERFNGRFGETFKVPRGVFPAEGARIMDLQDPEKKMSTTGGTPMGTVLMLDTPEDIARKFKIAVTDTGREVRRAPDKPGISNLVEIMAVASGTSPVAVEQEYASLGYAKFKQDVGGAVIELLAPIKRRYLELRGDDAELTRLLASGAEKARAVSAPTLSRMYDRMGFVPRVRD